MAAEYRDRLAWYGDRDVEGHRNFTLVSLVEAATTDGPPTIMACPGLPAIGAVWNFGGLDLWAFCTPVMRIQVHHEAEGEPNRWWRVEQDFTTKPLKRCQDTNIEDPLLEPMKISGSFVKYTKEATKDRYGDPLMNTGIERLRGPQVEFDEHRAQVKIEQNRASLGLATFTEMMNKVNDAPLWGLEARCVKLSNVSWERLVYGRCGLYYKRTFEFDICFETFDRDVLSEGALVLKGHWDTSGECDPEHLWVEELICDLPADKDNPQHYVQFKDWNGENARTLLDANGLPANTKEWLPVVGTADTGAAAKIHIEHYEEANLLLLGIPVSL